jgi:hypothetical protein
VFALHKLGRITDDESDARINGVEASPSYTVDDDCEMGGCATFALNATTGVNGSSTMNAADASSTKTPARHSKDVNIFITRDRGQAKVENYSNVLKKCLVVDFDRRRWSSSTIPALQCVVSVLQLVWNKNESEQLSVRHR